MEQYYVLKKKSDESEDIDVDEIEITFEDIK